MSRPFRFNGVILKSPATDVPSLSSFATGLRGKCPRCGQGDLFSDYLKVKDRCTNCDLSYAFADSGDGPAVFIMLIVGFVVVGAALVVEVTYAPPVWLHLLLWIPLICALSFALLRPLKGIMIAVQHKNDAHEARWAEDDTPSKENEHDR